MDIVQRHVTEGEKQYSLYEMLQHGFRENRGGFTFQLRGEFSSETIENLGGITLMDYLQMAVERYGAYLFADNKVWYLYDEAAFFEESDVVLRYRYNTDTVKVQEHTENLRTVVKAYGKKKEETEGRSDDDYYVTAVYKSREVERWGEREAKPVSDERFTNREPLLNWAKTQIIDTPEVSLDLVYTDREPISERKKVWFIHEIMGYNLWLKIERMTVYHPYAQKPPELGFMGRPKDLLQIQQKLQRSVQESEKKLSDTKYNLNNIKDTTDTLYKERIVAEVLEEDTASRIQTSAYQVQLKNNQGDFYFPIVRLEDIEVATPSQNGLMAKEDKTKLDAIESGAQRNNVTEAEKASWNAKQDAFLVSPDGSKWGQSIDNQGVTVWTKL
ncbi:Prophage endopeptidase tail [Listeria fleischmannii subsp. fleischmannii]|uniref:Prophage endopeptidase tail n=1 Tax=Listeria fleischmannii subsp. fleischmannii TaxID=1671902 RepID=A0A2X3HHG7_9LIST|nr:phage tail protein [Listeria fleischmannii]SQC70604.1 Prophage endopeptidase tail [Listeria fleischmannii subsp. fleischmannii]